MSELIDISIEETPSREDIVVSLDNNHAEYSEVVPPNANAKEGQAADAKATYEALSEKVDKRELSNLEGYAKTEDVDKALEEKANKSDIPNLDDYAKKTEIPSLSEYAKTEDINKALEEKANKSDIPNLDEYAKTEDVYNKLNNKVNKGDLPSLDDYAKKSDVDYELDKKANASDVAGALDEINTSLNEKVDKPELTSYAKISYVDAQLSRKANVDDIPSLDPLENNLKNVEDRVDTLEDEVGDILNPGYKVVRKSWNSNGKIYLDNRTITLVKVSLAINLKFVFPARPSNNIARDFYIRLELAGDTVPNITFLESDDSNVEFDAEDESWAEFEPYSVYVLRFLDSSEE